jgi:hypothetical protein
VICQFFDGFAVRKVSTENRSPRIPHGRDWETTRSGGRGLGNGPARGPDACTGVYTMTAFGNR